MPRHAAAVLVLALAAMPAGARAQAPNPSFNLVNKGDAPIREVFATPSGMENWGRSRTEGKVIAPGATFPVRLRADGNCIYDIKVVFAGGRAETRRRLDTCKAVDVPVGQGNDEGAQPAAAPGGRDASFRLINRGKSPITEVYATPANADKASDNLLQSGASLAPQGSQMFRMSGSQGCTYDLRVVFADKQSREKKNADLCKVTDLPVQ